MRRIISRIYGADTSSFKIVEYKLMYQICDFDNIKDMIRIIIKVADIIFITKIQVMMELILCID